MTKNDSFSESTISPEYFAICPLDGRYSSIGKKLSPYFSEYALVKNRVKVEVYWLVFLLENVNGSEILDSFDMSRISEIMAIYDDFSVQSFARIKEIEAVTNHDVKSVELFVAEKLRELGMDSLVSFVHLGCTSEDITNAAYANMIKEALYDVWIPAAEKLIEELSSMAISYADVPMLAHTHGQPATPTTVGKELTVFVYRLQLALSEVYSINPRAKFNGATGNYAAISVAFPDVNWPLVASGFVEDYLGLDFNPVTTQIESHDYMCQLFNYMQHFNNILSNLDLDMWLYIHNDYFTQNVVASEVGSSTMPHKVNPIRFENSEANVEISNALLGVLATKLSRSRMQRDLSDSSAQRNIGIAFGYSLQAIEQTTSGLLRVKANREKLAADLDNRWEVLAEPIQTILRKYGIPDAYDRLKKLTRGKGISREDIHKFIMSLEELSEDDRTTLLNLTPASYTGLATQIVDDEL